MKIQTWLNDSIKRLQAVGITSARLDVLIVLESTLEKSRTWIAAHDDVEFSESVVLKLNKKILQRENHTPLAYIIGSKEFYGRKFSVNESVLVPRPESEDTIDLLIDLASSEQWLVDGKKTNQLPTINYPLFTILDIGTGSGILAITAQLELPDAVVVATDISEVALVVAKQNAEHLNAPVQFYQADMLDIPTSIKPDVILANLPYVPDTLITSQEITKEPTVALFSGKDGLNHYRRFWNQVINLNPKPETIITESLENQHTYLSQLALTAGYKLTQTKALTQLFTQIK